MCFHHRPTRRDGAVWSNRTLRRYVLPFLLQCRSRRPIEKCVLFVHLVARALDPNRWYRSHARPGRAERRRRPTARSTARPTVRPSRSAGEGRLGYLGSSTVATAAAATATVNDSDDGRAASGDQGHRRVVRAFDLNILRRSVGFSASTSTGLPWPPSPSVLAKKSRRGCDWSLPSMLADRPAGVLSVEESKRKGR